MNTKVIIWIVNITGMIFCLIELAASMIVIALTGYCVNGASTSCSGYTTTSFLSDSTAAMCFVAAIISGVSLAPSSHIFLLILFR